MGNTFSLGLIRLIQRLSMILTLGCCGYVIIFLFSKNQDNGMVNNSSAAKPVVAALSLPSADDGIKPYPEAVNNQARDIFSLAAENLTGVANNTPKGQLPDNLKVVGIIVAKPSQIIIEDSLSKKTYFIDETTPQAGIKIIRVNKDEMTINYQGQDIPVPIIKS